MKTSNFTYMNSDSSADFALTWRQLYNRGAVDTGIVAGKTMQTLQGKNPFSNIRGDWQARQKMVRDLDAKYPSADIASLRTSPAYGQAPRSPREEGFEGMLGNDMRFKYGKNAVPDKVKLEMMGM